MAAPNATLDPPKTDREAPPAKLVPLLQWIRGMCSDEDPHELIDEQLARAIDMVLVADTPEVHKARAHPLRARLFEELRERVASPNELATKLREPLGNVAYHVRSLESLGCIELVRTAPRRGAVEHYYRATADLIA